jgi:hypothetical protein
MNVPTVGLIVSIGSLFLTGVVAWNTLRIAHQQKEIAEQQALTARNKLRLDLFDRRLPIYEAAMILADTVVRKGDISFEETQEFRMATKSVRFLFNQELHDYCDELRKQAMMVFGGQQKIKGLDLDSPRLQARR